MPTRHATIARLRQSAPLRWLLATLIFAALVAQAVSLPIAHEAKANRRHIQVVFSGERAIVQVFVECRLAYAFAGERADDEHVDLGWLKNESIVTIQTRGRKRRGDLTLAYEHDSIPVSLVGDAAAAERALPADRAGPASSWQVGGHEPIRKLGCQRDLLHFGFASASAANWSETSAKSLGRVIAVADAIPKILGIFGLAWLFAAVFVGRARGVRLRRRTAAGVLLVAAELAIEVLGSIAANDFPLAFALCIVVGAGALVVLLLWLLRADIHRWTAD
ncbi:MAG TPA: hypothetical protein VK605_06655 [Solirubrobacteraceae bacterium]|nr:hypothetical protein [Solirubrobacteraceae bacterium]